MAKTKKITQTELKKFFEQAKKKLQQLGKESKVWIKKGEMELSRLSRIGRLELDVVNLSIKKEKLFKDIGKRVVELDLAKEIGDSTIKSMSNKAGAVISESKKKRREIARFRKGLLKGGAKQSKKKR